MSAPTPGLPWWAFTEDSAADVEAVRAPLTPEEHTDRPLSPEERERRARLLRDLRTANQRPRR